MTFYGIIQTCLRRMLTIKSECVRWALYTKPDFGEGQVGETLVYPVQADKNELYDCTEGNVNGVLRQIESFKPLGKGKTDEHGWPYYNAAYFLGPELTTSDGSYPLAEGRQTPIRSLAITIAQFTLPKIYTLCAKDKKDCYCYDYEVGWTLMVPDVTVFPTENPLGALIDCVLVDNPPDQSDDPKKCKARFVPRTPGMC